MTRDDDHPDAPPARRTWRAPTRRTFVAMLGAAAAALAVRATPSPVEPAPRSTWAGKTRWIGHC